jgi:tetratricopeptide (TPR) repeat protein
MREGYWLAMTEPDTAIREQVGAALAAGDLASAERLLRQRLAEAPGDLDALTALGNVLAQAGLLRDAAALFHQALALAPAAHEIRLHLSALHQELSQYPIALALLGEVPNELRQSFDVRARVAALVGGLGQRDEQVAIYRALVAERPDDAKLWTDLGNALNYAGDTAAAIEALRKAAAIRPDFGEPWWGLANLKSFTFDGDDLAAMQAALGKAIPEADAIHFNFALGRAFDQRREYRRAFDHYAAGNRLRAQSLPRAQMRVTGLVDAAVATFTPALFERHAGSGCAAEGPIFVVGLQRSGSTLVEQILASHPDIEGTAELMAMQYLSDELATLAARAGVGFFDQVARGESALFRRVGERYLERTSAFRSTGKRLFVDKLPANWMNAGLIRLALPNARIIDARRHPMACGFSNFAQLYGSGVAFSYSLPAIGQYYRDYLRLMRHFDAVQPGAVHHVINERLIADPEREVRVMLDFIGAAFDPACLEFYATKRAVHTPSAAQVRRPINRDGVDKWRDYEPWLGPLKDALGPAIDDWER